MKPVFPSRDQFEVLRGIAAAGFDYSATKRICSRGGWELVEDEPDIGFVQYSLCIGPDPDNRRLLSIGTPQIDGPPHLHVALVYFPDVEGGDPEEHERTPFDKAYRRMADGASVILGEAQREGTYEYPHRPGWSYGFRVWRLPESQVIVLQDEHDIQFGMDVSLWLFAPAPDVAIPLAY